MSATDPVSEARELLSAVDGLTDPGTPEIPAGALDWMVSAHRLLAALAEEVERLRAEPTEAEIEAGASALMSIGVDAESLVDPRNEAKAVLHAARDARKANRD